MIGYLTEHGPFRAQEDLTLKQDDYSWTKVANMLYIESPTGVGYSYSTTGSDEDYMSGDRSVAKDNLSLINSPGGASDDSYRATYFPSAIAVSPDWPIICTDRPLSMNPSTELYGCAGAVFGDI